MTTQIAVTFLCQKLRNSLKHNTVFPLCTIINLVHIMLNIGLKMIISVYYIVFCIASAYLSSTQPHVLNYNKHELYDTVIPVFPTGL